MATFQYTAVDKFGKEKRGSIDATAPDRAAAMLKGEGLDRFLKRSIGLLK